MRFIKKHLCIMIILSLVLGVFSYSTPVDAAKKKIITSITAKDLNNGTLTLQKGEKKKLVITIKPSKASNKVLKYKSSNKKIVTINKEGMMYAKKKGKATITVSTTDGSNLSLKIKVTVGTKVNAILDSNGMSSSAITLKQGDTKKNSLKVYPTAASNKKLIWTSSKPSVATVSTKGKITAVDAGTTTITATSTDGTKIKYKYTVNVYVPVKDLLFSSEESKYWEQGGDNTFNISPGQKMKINTTVMPENASNKAVTYSTNHPEVAKVDAKGVVTAVSGGKATIKVASNDGHRTENVTIHVYQIRGSMFDYIAHRGRNEQAPENSLKAYELALKKQSTGDFDGIEIDVWPTADDEFVITHDENLNRMCNVNRKVTDMTFDEVTSTRIVNGTNANNYNQTVPSLDDALNLLSDYPDKKMYIELKREYTEEQIDKLLSEINEYHFEGLKDEDEKEYPITLIMFNKKNISRIRANEEYDDANGSIIPIVFLYNDYVTDGSVFDSVFDTCKKYKTGFGANFKHISANQVDKLHSYRDPKDKDFRIKVNMWGADNFIEEYLIAYSLGADIITTDYGFFR